MSRSINLAILLFLLYPPTTSYFNDLTSVIMNLIILALSILDQTKQ